MEELEELEQEELSRELLNVGDKEEEPSIKLPDVPSPHLPAEPGTPNTSLVSRTRGWGSRGILEARIVFTDLATKEL